jgi:hypothetical protein
MIKRNLLTDAEVARVLNCTVQDLPQHQQRGEIEEIPFPDHRMYRIIRKRQAARDFEGRSSVETVSDYPGLKSDQPEMNRPDRDQADAATPLFDEPVGGDVPLDGVNVSLLLEQNKDRTRLIREIKKNHSRQMSALQSVILQLRQHRLALIIALEVFLGAAIIFGTLARDKAVEARSDAYDMQRMAAYKDQSVETMKADVDALNSQVQQREIQLRESKVNGARLEAQLAIRDMKIDEARKMISRLIRENHLSRAN